MEAKTKFWYDNDGSVSLAKINDEIFLDALLPKVYTVHFHEMRGFYLKTEFDKFKLPEKLYGNTQKQADRVLKTYDSRATNTGVLLTGDKGAGKTLLAQAIGNNLLAKNDVPVILINQPFSGTAFNSFIDQIGEAAFMFDEFGKIYSPNGSNRAKVVGEENNAGQDGLLTLLDGASRAKRMFILTENDVNKINNYLLDRPSRVYYHFKYRKLEEAAITEYCADRNLTDDLAQAIIEVSRRMVQFNFDMLQTIVEECVRYEAKPEEVEDLLTDLNIDFDAAGESKLRILQIIDESTDTPIVLAKASEGKLQNFPINFYDNVGAYEQEIDEDDPLDDRGRYYAFEKRHIVYRTAERVVFRRNGRACIAEIVQKEAYASGYYNQMANKEELNASH